MNRILRVFILLCLIVTPSLVRALSVSITVNGSSSNPYYKCFTPGSFDTTLSIQFTTTGCSSTANYCYTITGPTSASGCGGSPIVFFNYETTGTYVITVTSTCGGATATATDTVIIHPNSVINFATTNIPADTLLQCGPRTVHFTNLSTGIDTSSCHANWYWVIDGGTPVTGFTTSATFTTGYHTVTLIFENACGCGGSMTWDNMIKIDSPAHACFTTSDTTPICSAPATVYYNGGCSDNAAIYRWAFSDGGTDTGSNPSHTFYSPGYFTSTLTVTSTGHCSSTIVHDSDIYVGSFTATMGALPAAGTASDTVCQGSVVTFSDSTYIGGIAVATSYNFQVFSGGTEVDSSAGSNPVALTFDSSGLFTIYDNVADSFGCPSVATRNLWVRASPVITTLYASTYYRCTEPMVDTFHGGATPTGLRYTWAFGDGHDTSGVNMTTVTHTFSDTGSHRFTDTLIVMDSHGCADTLLDTTKIILGPPHFHVTLSADSGCVTPGNPLCFTYSITTASPTPSFTPFTIDSVLFDDTTACYGFACSDSGHCFHSAPTDTSVHGYRYLTFYWHLPAYLGGCTGTYLDSVRVGGTLPDGHLPYSDSVCPHTLVVLNDSCTNCTWTHWSIHAGLGLAYTLSGDTLSIVDTTSVFFTQPGTFPAQLIMTVNGCSDTVTDSIFVFRPDSALVSETVLCANRDSVRYSANTTSGAFIIHYTWMFGDGGTATTTAPTVWHYYTGTHDTGWMHVTVYDTANAANHFCYNVSHDSFYIGKQHYKFTVDFDTICTYGAVNFTGPTNRDGTTFNDYYWYWEDGTGFSHTTTNLEAHYFTNTGIYNVYCIIINGSGCRDTTDSMKVYVAAPHGTMTVSDTFICAGESVCFTDNNTDILPIKHPHNWVFNGSPSVAGSTIPSSTIWVAGPGPFHTSGDTCVTFSRAGLYHISLTDTDTYHCWTKESTIVHAVKPHAYFYSPDSGSATHVCTGVGITFIDTNTNCTYSWSFDGGATWDSAGATVTHIFTANGTYTIKCAISSNGTGGFPFGCSDTATRGAYMTVGPISVGFTNVGDVSPVSCPPLHIGLVANNTSYTYAWHVYSPSGAETTFTGLLLSDIVFGSGTYSVTLVGTSALGCMDSISTSYLIGGPSGYITVNPDSGCNPIPVTLMFHDTGVVAASSNYIWTTCPTGTVTTTSSSLHLFYDTSGVYCPPTVIIQNGSCAVLITYPDSMYVFPLPFVTLTHLPILCYDSSATIIGIGAGPGGSYLWSPTPSFTSTVDAFGNDFSTVSPFVTTTYTVIGTTQHGCSDTEMTTVTVDPQLHIHVAARDSMCIGKCDTLIVTGVPGAAYIWEGVGTSCAVCDTNVVCITSTKTFTVSGTDAAGCKDETTFKVTVNPAPILHVLPDPAYVCKGYDTTHLNAYGAQSYVWKPRLYLSCDSCEDPICSVPSNLVYSVTGTSKFGCVDSLLVPVTVYDTTHNFIRPIDTSICYGQSTQIVGAGGVAWEWRPVLGLSDPNIYDPIATPSVTTTYTVYITENACFKDTLHTTVVVIPLPILRMPPDVTIIAGNSVQLYAMPTNQVLLTNWMWTPADTTLTCTTCPRPVATPLNTTTYSVTATTIEGCPGSGEVTITVLCQNSQIFIPNTFTPNGDGVNDRFYVSGSGLGNVQQMAIYNRWGEMVFSASGIPSNDPAAGWDGTYKGQVLAPDVFVYKIIVLCSTGESFSFQGDISIVR